MYIWSRVKLSLILLNKHIPKDDCSLFRQFLSKTFIQSKIIKGDFDRLKTVKFGVSTYISTYEDYSPSVSPSLLFANVCNIR